MKLNSHAGPISKNWMSSKNDGFLPSILCPMNCPIHAKIKIKMDIFQIDGSINSIIEIESIIVIAIISIPKAMDTDNLK